MIRVSLMAALMVACTPAFAAETAATTAAAAPLHRGQVLRDVKGARLGVVDSVASDGTIGLIVDAQYVRIPAALLTNVDGKAQTTLTKKDVKALR